MNKEKGSSYMTHKIIYIEDNSENMYLMQKVLKGDAEKTLEASCDAYLPKPVNMRELYARVEKYLSGNGE